MANNDLIVQSNLKDSTSSQTTVSYVSQVNNTASSSNNVTPVNDKQVIASSKNVKSEKNQSVSKSAQEQVEQRNEAIKEKVAEMNQYVQKLDRKLEFTVDDSSGDTVVKVIDSETDELIRQIPSEEVLRIKKAVDTYRGILLETKA